MYQLLLLVALIFNPYVTAMELPVERIAEKVIDYKKAIRDLGHAVVADLQAEHDAVGTAHYMLLEMLEHKSCSEEQAAVFKEILEKLRQPYELANQQIDMNAPLQEDDMSFSMIQERMAWFTNTLNLHDSLLTPELKALLSKVIEFYRKYILDFVKTNTLEDASRREARLKLLEEKVAMSTDAFGEIAFFQISQEWARLLGNTKEDGTRLKERAASQTHDTYKSASGKVFFKSARALSDLKPEYELAVYAFYSILYPHIRVITPSCFIACNNVVIQGKKQTFYFQATTTIDGITLGRILKANKEDDLPAEYRHFFGNGLYKNLNFEAFSALVTGSFIVNPSDWKPDNLIVQEGDGAIVGIDNDAAFAYAITKMDTGVTKHLHYVDVKNILYLMREPMSRPIHPSLVKRLKEMEPEEIVREWLSFLQEKERVYAKLKKYSFFPDPLYTPPHLSIKFAPDIIKQVIITLSELKSHAAENGMTHETVFYKMHELVQRLYKAIGSQHRQIRDAYAEIRAADEKSALEDILDLNKPTLSGQKTFQVLRKETHFANDYEDRTQGIDKAFSEFNQGILLYKGQTKLHEAVINALKKGGGELNCVEALLREGIDAEACDNYGNSALDIAFGASNDWERENDTMHENRIYAVRKLVSYALGKKIKMPRALDFFERNPQLNLARRQLENMNGEFAWRSILQQVFLEKKVAGKECKISCFPKKRYVPEKFCDELWDKDNKFKPKNRCYDKKNCKKAGCKHLGFGRKESSYIEVDGKIIWFKRFPNVEGFEYAVARLVKNLIGAGSTFNELVYINNEFYQVSFGIEGDNLQELFDRPENKLKNPDCLQQLDPENTSGMICTAMIVGPEDQKPDNIQIARNLIVCIDNENSFFPAHIRDKRGKIVRAIKSILFSLDQMEDPVHPAIRERFLAMEPEEILIKWLRELEAHHLMCLSMKNDDSTGKILEIANKCITEYNCYIGVPFAPQMLERVLGLLTKLRDTLQENPDITHIDLLLQLYPSLETYKKYLSLPLTVHDRFKKGDLPLFNRRPNGTLESNLTTKEVIETTTVPYQDLDESIRLGTCCNPSQGLKRIEQLRKNKLGLGLQGANATEFVKMVEEFLKMDDHQKEKFVESTDFSRKKNGLMVATLSAQEEFFKLDAFQKTPWNRLKIKNADGLSVALFQSLKLDALTKLTLSGCKNINETLLDYLSQCKLLDRLHLSHLPNLLRVGQTRLIGSDAPFTSTNLTLFTITNCDKLQEICLDIPALCRLIASKLIKLNKVKINCPLLNSLDIKGDELLDEATLNRIIASCPSLKTLYLQGCDKIQHKALRTAEPQFPIKTYLELPESIRASIENSLDLTGSLNAIYLSSAVNDDDFEKLCHMLEINNPGNFGSYIQLLNLGCSAITDRRMQALAKLLRTNDVLKTLELGQTQCTIEGLIYVLEALKTNKGVATVNFSDKK